MIEPIESNLEPAEDGSMEFKEKMDHGGIGIPQYEKSPAATPEKEASKEISMAEKDGAYGKILSKLQSQTDDDLGQDEVADDAREGAEKTHADLQVQHLISIASQKGVVHAVKVARHMEDNYILDTFHDRMLADELHDALVEKGLIKEI